MKSCVIVTAHPDQDSLCYANAAAIEQAAKKQRFRVQRFEAFDFPLIPYNPLKERKFPPEFDAPTDALAEAEVVVVCCPMWNYGVPGALKNFLDGVIQAKKLFQFVPIPVVSKLAKMPLFSKLIPGAAPKGLMKARKVLVVWTADGPGWYYRLLPWKNPLWWQLKADFLYCGAKSVKQKFLPMTRKRSEEEIKKWLGRLEEYEF